MNILLDTNSFIWWVDNYERLSTGALEAIHKAENIFVSSVTNIEIAIKQSIGKITFNYNIEEEIKNENFLELPVYGRHAKYLEKLPPIHKDPFDRILISQAISEGLTIITSDSDIQKYNVPIIST